MKYKDIFFKNGIEYKIEIKLDDEFENGHDDFSITASIYQYKSTPKLLTGGCCHKEIIAVKPEYLIFVKLHLSDWKGVPMYVVDNGSYLIKEKEYDAAKSLLRISDEELEYLKRFTESKDYFTYAIQQLGLLERWKAKADTAIAYLMKLCKKENRPKFKGTGHLKPLSKVEFDKIAKLEKDGYFNCKAIEQRNKIRIQSEIERIIRNNRAKLRKELSVLLLKYHISKLMLKVNPFIDNWIYYPHTNELVLNWHTNSCYRKYSDFEINITKELIANNRHTKHIKVKSE